MIKSYLLKITRILLTKWFWLNYLFLLIVTLPFSLLEITINGQKIRSVPLWECYWNLIQRKITPELLMVLSIHIFLTFFICLLIWVFVYKPISHKENP